MDDTAGRASDEPHLDGAELAVVREAVASGDPLPGTRGFAGRLDGALVRDVLGRKPLFFDDSAADPTADGAWSDGRERLTESVSVPAGHAVDGGGERTLWTLPSVEPAASVAATVDTVRQVVDASLDAVGPDGLAIAFSGGVDSALLAARFDAPLYVTGFPESHDVAAARSAAASLDREVRVVEIDHGALEAAIPRVVRATGRTNAMDVAIAIPLLLTAERAVADGHDRLAVGQGVDELFGGYAKVAKAPDDHRVAATTVRGARREVLAALPDGLERDALAIRAAGAEPVLPYLHDRVVRAALALPGDGLVGADGTRKVAFRAAVRPSLPDEIAGRDKKAMQYGSLVARELDRLARQAGFKRRMDDNVERFVRSTLE